MTAPATDADLARVKELLAAATPISDSRPPIVVRVSYLHGGGRMYVNEPPEGGGRDLIINVYDAGNREFYFHAWESVTAILARLTLAEAERDAAVADAARARAALEKCAAAMRPWTSDLDMSDAFVEALAALDGAK